MLSKQTRGEFYRGKHKKAGPALILAIVAIIIIVFLVMAFYGLQKYIVITNDGIKLDVPMLNGGKSVMTADDEGNVIIEYEKVDAELVVGEADYSNVIASAGDGLEAVKGGFISAANVSESTASSYAESLSADNAVVLELKPASGMLAWKSNVEFAAAYGLNGTTDLEPVISALKGKDIYVIAQLNCLIDNTLASHYSQMILKTSDGKEYSDGNGTWLDPYNSDLRSYIIALCRELSEMGVDEIVLQNVKIPSADVNTYAFSASTSTEPTPVSAVSGFALDVTRALKSCTAKISVRCDSEIALTDGEDSSNGQNAELFFKLFDRVYCVTGSDRASSLASSAAKFIEIGDASSRFVPMCSGDAPQSGSYVHLD